MDYPMKQLKPCPRCGGEGKLFICLDMVTYKIECIKCQYNTLPWQMSKWAVTEWNENRQGWEYLSEENCSISRVFFVGVPWVLLYFYAIVWSILEFYSFVEGWIKNG